MLHEVDSPAAPMLGEVVEPLSRLRPVASVMLKPSAFQRSRSALSCWKPRASSTSGKGKTRMRSAMPFCWTSAFSVRSRFRRSFSAVASAAFRAVRSLSAVRARAMVGAICSAMPGLLGPRLGVHQDARGRSICNGATGAAIWP